MNLSLINEKLQTAKITLDVFGALNGSIMEQLEELKSLFNLMAKTVHPDRYITESDKKIAHNTFINLKNWYELAIKDIEGKTYGQKIATKIQTKKNTYFIYDLFKTGDAADIYNCVDSKNPGRNLVLKIANDKSNNDLINNEIKVLKKLYGETDKKSDLITNHTCAPVEVFEADGRQAIVFEKLNGFYTLEDVIKTYPNGIDPKSMAWMFRRLLSILAVVHDLGYVHCGVIPSNFMINPDNHNGKLIDFIGTSEIRGKNKVVIPEYKDFYPPEALNKIELSPATDIFMAVKCMLMLTGKQEIPSTIMNLFKSCLIESPAKRPNKSLDIYHDFSKTIDAIWERKFIKFEM